jgi:hypothetical protein
VPAQLVLRRLMGSAVVKRNGGQHFALGTLLGIMVEKDEGELEVLMESQEPRSTRRSCSVLAAIKGSLVMMAVVLFFDVGLDGFYMYSLIICPLWCLISLGKSAVERPGWRIAVLRFSMPLLTFAIAKTNGELQWRISDVNAERVIKACEEFRVVNGRYPSELDELVPKYLTSVPRAKYCVTGKFDYYNSDDHCSLSWRRFGLYRRIYSFDSKRWSNLD